MIRPPRRGQGRERERRRRLLFLFCVVVAAEGWTRAKIEGAHERTEGRVRGAGAWALALVDRICTASPPNRSIQGTGSVGGCHPVGLRGVPTRPPPLRTIAHIMPPRRRPAQASKAPTPTTVHAPRLGCPLIPPHPNTHHNRRDRGHRFRPLRPDRSTDRARAAGAAGIGQRPQQLQLHTHSRRVDRRERGGPSIRAGGPTQGPCASVPKSIRDRFGPCGQLCPRLGVWMGASFERGRSIDRSSR